MIGHPTQRWLSRLGGVIAFAATFLALLGTSPFLTIVWDEGYTLGREARVRAWIRAMADPAHFARSWSPPEVELVQTGRLDPPAPTAAQVDTRAKLLDQRVLEWFWPFGREEPHGHPPFYAIVGLIGDLVAPAWEPLARARLGPMLAFSLAAGALFAFFTRRWGVWAGTLAAGAWGLQPQLFGHAHYATYDALLMSLWVGSILAFSEAVETTGSSRSPRWGWVVLFGVLAGWAADTKLTGWFLPIPFFVWTALYRSRRGLLTLVIGGIVVVLVLYMFNPPWWGAPIGGIERFLKSNLSRARTTWIPVLFLGQVIETPRNSLPWYNTLVWTLFVTPVGMLALALVGVGRALRRFRTEPFGILALGHWAFLLLLRALPHTPGHDGVRQFLAAFGCLTLMAGLGGASAVERFGRLGKVAIGAALAEGLISIAVMMPVPLAYYSPIVGGLPGATAIGMEPTYYWDALTPQALDWLNTHTGPHEKVKFATEPTSWYYLRQTGRLRPNVFLREPGVYTWYVVQNRPGAMTPIDHALVTSAKPAYVVTKLGVPLIWVFAFSDVEALLREQGAGGGRR